MKILITGSSGTIGTRLYEKLSGKHEVIGADKRPNKWCASVNRDTIITDFRHEKELEKLPQDIDIIVHLAANARVYELVKEPRMALDNMIINFNVFDFAHQHSINRIIFASSRETYGNISYNDGVSEDMVKIENCESPYAASKSSGESLLYAYQNVYDIDFVILRFSNVYGMYDDSDRVIPLWMRRMLKNEDIIVFGKDKLLDFTYIDDTIDGITSTIERFNDVNGQAINISYGQEVHLLDVSEKLRGLMGSTSKLIIEDNRPGEVWRFTADISKARKFLDYNPKTDIDTGLKITVEWYQNYYAREGQIQ